jgi:glycosyltransferase involved in cell wall biosynthesis
LTAMKVMFLFPYPLGESPSQRFRFEQYFDVLKKAGIHYDTQAFWDLETWKLLYKPERKFRKALGFVRGVIRRFRVLLRLHSYDFVFIHRECAPIGPPVIEWLISFVLRKRIIYDFDDAIWLPNTSAENRLAALVKWNIKVGFICSWSYKISCGNLYLCDYAYKYNRNVVLNPTTIDTENLHNPKFYPSSNSPAKIVIGWTGSHSTLKYLKQVEGVLLEIAKRHPEVTVEVIADRAPAINLPNLAFRPWSQETEIKDLAHFDIGIMPLTDDIWAQGKCGFKALQYMAMEIPTVASPVGVNTTIIDHGEDGLLASNAEEWNHHLETLIAKPDLRLKLGKKGREKVTRNYSVRSNADNFLSLFT